MSNQVSYTNKVRISQLPKYVKLAQAVGKTLYILGASGVGKSVMINTIAKTMFPNSEKPLIDIRLGGKEYADVFGIRVPEKEDDGSVKNKFSLADHWPDADWEGIIFFDELSHAEPYIQKTAYSALRDGHFEGYTLPKGAVRVAAGNRVLDNGGTSELLSPLANDLIIVEIDYNSDKAIEEWLSWASKENLHPAVIAWIKKNPQDLFTFEQDRPEGMHSFATARSVERVSQELYAMESCGFNNFSELKPAIEGTVGTVVNNLETIYRLGKYIPEVKDILSGKVKGLKETPKKEYETIALGYYLAESCFQRIKQKMLDNESREVVADNLNNVLTFCHANFAGKHADSFTGMVKEAIAITAFNRDGSNKPDMQLRKLVLNAEGFQDFIKVSHNMRSEYQEYLEEANRLG